MTHEVEVWDWPLRAFHWLLAASVALAFASGELGGNAMIWHRRIGLFILALLVFRLLWGFLGSEQARFASFFPTLSRLRAYFSGRWQGLGHNPLGALSVFALLGLLTLQVTTGLFANDDIAFQGPLNPLVDEALAHRLTGWHHLAFDVLAWLVGLHLAAIVFHARVHRDNLVVPMLTGKKHLAVPVPAEASSLNLSPVRLLGAIVISASVAWTIGQYGDFAHENAPPPTSVKTMPDW
jgi:cytochrome b